MGTIAHIQLLLGEVCNCTRAKAESSHGEEQKNIERALISGLGMRPCGELDFLSSDGDGNLNKKNKKKNLRKGVGLETFPSGRGGCSINQIILINHFNKVFLNY